MGSTIAKLKNNNKYHVKFLVIFYWAAKNGFYHHEAKKLQIQRKMFFLYRAAKSTITNPKKPQIPRKINLYFLLAGEKWVVQSRSQKNYKFHVNVLCIFYRAVNSTITKPKKLQIPRKISFYFILDGEKCVLPSRSQKNYQSHGFF